jgi:pimeloyl-ACP methyl ester carboxylesterase
MKRVIIFCFLLYICSSFNVVIGNDSLYKELPVTLHTATGDLFGTLTVPVQKTRMPVALIIAGSGPTDRNGNNPMMKNESLHKLAIALADSGIASLRYDKRAIAESKAAAKSEADLRFDDYVADARDWISMLRKDNRFSRIIVIGHSEGSLIGMVAAHKNADAFISIAGAGRPADKILKEQLDKQPQAVKDLSFPIIDSLVAGKTVSTVNPMLFSLFRPSVQPYLISWFKYDPAVEIRKLSIPVLVIQGTNDIQVSMEDAQLLAKAGKAPLMAIDHMNHIFRIVEGDRNANIATYNDPSLPIAGELGDSIVRFIRKMKE